MRLAVAPARDHNIHRAGYAIRKIMRGDNVEVVVERSRKVSIRKTAEVSRLLGRVRKLRGKLPGDFRFDRLSANER
jgi:antitoxin MazE